MNVGRVDSKGSESSRTLPTPRRAGCAPVLALDGARCDRHRHDHPSLSAPLWRHCLRRTRDGLRRCAYVEGHQAGLRPTSTMSCHARADHAGRLRPGQELPVRTRRAFVRVPCERVAFSLGGLGVPRPHRGGGERLSRRVGRSLSDRHHRRRDLWEHLGSDRERPTAKTRSSSRRVQGRPIALPPPLLSGEGSRSSRTIQDLGCLRTSTSRS